MKKVNLADLQESVQDRSAFKTLSDYLALCHIFLNFVKNEKLTRIISPSHSNYIFYQYSAKYGHKITRPLNINSIKSLVGDDVFWDVTQLLFAFVGTTQSFFENDLKFTIQAFYSKGVQTAPAEKICDCYLNKSRELYKESEKFYVIVKELQNIALILESEPLTFKKLEKLKKRTEIMKTVQLLRDQFREDICGVKDQKLN